MQLFICPKIEEKGSDIIIKDNIELVNQLRKVLRAKPWYTFFVQPIDWIKRLKVELVTYTDKEVKAKVLWIENSTISNKPVWMLISLPNKQEKLELIIQKLTEVWVSNIILRSSERSQLNSLNENKMKRIEKIAKEAVEQSRWWSIPKIEVIWDIKTLQNKRDFIVFDLPKDNQNKEIKKWTHPLLWVIGPEWGLTENDYKNFPTEYKVMSLWESVLRMETAAIIWWRYIKNYL
jgi:16S rRNA (uracil1498-N3)-methyltransferase